MLAENPEYFPMLRPRNDVGSQRIGVAAELGTRHTVECGLEVRERFEFVFVDHMGRGSAEYAAQKSSAARAAKLGLGELVGAPGLHDGYGLAELSVGDIEMPLTDQHVPPDRRTE